MISSVNGLGTVASGQGTRITVTTHVQQGYRCATQPRVPGLEWINQRTFQRCFGNRTARCSLARKGLLEEATGCGASRSEDEVVDSEDLGKDSLLLNEEEHVPVGRE